MADTVQLHDLRAGLSARAGLDWEIDVYSGTDHAFTFPDSPNYHARSDHRAWTSTVRLLRERASDV